MQDTIKSCLDTLTFGDRQVYQHLTVVPLHHAANGAPRYIALADAMDAHTLTVTEVSEGGSVPELLVDNASELPVLIIDGEELLGAKQNRILNTTLLLRERSRTTVPVSCTEQGRWSYQSKAFSVSQAMLERKIRSAKSRSVRASLAREGTAHSDQGEVWEGIRALHRKAACPSPTGAMHDAFQARQQQLDECLRCFARQEGQVGLLVLIGGQVAGFDLVSRPEVYARLHDKLVRSYVLDALLDQPGTPTAPEAAAGAARAFLDSTQAAREEVFPSVGYGRDHRYEAAGVTGSALVHDHHVIHAAFLSVEPAREDRACGAPPSHLASLRRRRSFRVE
jgi:hypothetical protein